MHKRNINKKFSKTNIFEKVSLTVQHKSSDKREQKGQIVIH
jgi:hypothetical protein